MDSLASRYEIRDELGRGGMATVYRAAIATLYLHLGNLDEFFRWMERGIEAGDPFALSLNREFLWADARHDARYAGLLRKVGLIG